jgi:hypothetical protein
MVELMENTLSSSYREELQKAISMLLGSFQVETIVKATTKLRKKYEETTFLSGK